MKCPDCSQGFEYPVLEMAGVESYLECPVCHEWFTRSGEKLDKTQLESIPEFEDLNWMYEGVS